MKYSQTVLTFWHKGMAAYAFSMNFGTRLEGARKAKKLTQADLGKGLGTDGADVGKQVVWGWEKGNHFPRVDQLALICQRLSVSADFLLFGELHDASAKLQVAKAVVEELTDEDRLLLFSSMTVPGVTDEEVERRMPITKKKVKA